MGLGCRQRGHPALPAKGEWGKGGLHYSSARYLLFHFGSDTIRCCFAAIGNGFPFCTLVFLSRHFYLRTIGT
ncbi:hypothetical protein PoMZ_08812 [Pyricularia oryzae]|uniref:Uncharacterized protein n=1 Tax=Pyricularia oryzae TaxID=318829 RepID=A0A4P7NIM6_PYROR|nr:hypothetical protein PoMZ_08812 [Pyricularia oryzae]